jgi:putative membrane protein
LVWCDHNESIIVTDQLQSANEVGTDEKLAVPTLLALERTRIAYERTMMSWVRTATSLITFGFSVYKFFQLEMAGKDFRPSQIGSREFALIMIGIGLLSLAIGTIEHRRDLRTLKEEYPGMPRSGTRITGGLIGALGVMAIAAVLLRQ